MALEIEEGVGEIFRENPQDVWSEGEGKISEVPGLCLEQPGGW